jgi:oligosaccharide repeat unit polymerase
MILKKKYLLIASFLAISVIGTILGVIISEGGQESILFGFSSLALLMLLTPIFINKHYSISEPLTFVIISFLAGTYFKSFYLLLNSSNDVVSNKLLLGLDISELTYGSLVILIALSMFTFGYLTNLPKLPIPKIIRSYDSSFNKVIFFSVLFLLLSFTSFYLLVNTLNVSFSSVSDLSAKRFQSDDTTSASRLNDSAYYFYRLSLLAKAPMYILFYYKIKNNISWRSLLGTLLIISIFINMFVPFFVSNKAGMILPIADLLMISFLLRRKVNMKRVLLLGFVIINLISIVATIRGGDSVSSHSFYDKAFGGRYFLDITKTAHIINAIPDKIEYLNGLTLISWINPLLPFSMKFPLDVSPSGLGFYIGGEVFGNPYSGVPPGIIAEMYMNFGIIGIIFGMLLTGILFKTIHSSLSYYLDSSSLAVIIYAIIMVRMPTFLFNNGVAVTILKISADLILVLIFMILVKKFKR